MGKAEFVMLAHDHSEEKHGYCGYYASEKLDGIRCLWDGGVTRGMLCTEVPWANTAKDARYLRPPKASGLWSRYGKVIQAPDWFLDYLPRMPLDGELHSGVKGWQILSSIIKDIVPGPKWDYVKYAIFDSPPIKNWLSPRYINLGDKFKKHITESMFGWYKARCPDEWHGFLDTEPPFYTALAALRETAYQFIYVHKQTQLTSASTSAAKKQAEELYADIIKKGGEGMILRSPISIWHPERSWSLLKVKPVEDAEGTVIGYKWGKSTDADKTVSGEAGTRMLGLMGSVRLRLDSGKEFDLASGFTMEQRSMTQLVNNSTDTAYDEKPISTSDAVYANAVSNQGKEVPEWIDNPFITRGTRICFKYRELSDDGIPKEARFHRVRIDD